MGALGAALARNLGQLFTCFVGSALLNVASQQVFARVAPDHKDAWLAAALLCGTLASIAGVQLASQRGLPRRFASRGAAALMACAALLCAALVALGLSVTHPLPFALICVFVRFILQFLTQELDRRAVALAAEQARRVNDQIGLAMRFGGMLLGPLCFALLAQRPALLTACLLTLALGAAMSAALMAQAPAHLPLPSAPHTTHDPTMRAARSLYAAYYLLASSLIYALTDVHALPDASRRGGALITLVYASAIGATVAALARPTRRARTPRDMLPAAALISAVGLALPTGPAAQPLAQHLGAVGLGLTFALFQLAARDHATRAAQRGEPGALAAYNNLANTSALYAYLVMAALVALAHALALPYAALAGLGVTALALHATPLILRASRA